MKKCLSVILAILLLLPILPVFADEEAKGLSETVNQTSECAEVSVDMGEEDTADAVNAIAYPWIYATVDMREGVTVKRGEETRLSFVAYRGSFSKARCMFYVYPYGQSTSIAGFYWDFTSEYFTWKPLFDTTDSRFPAGRFLTSFLLQGENHVKTEGD